MFSHVVIFWTDPANPKAADELLAGMEKYLRPIPGVLHFHDHFLARMEPGEMGLRDGSRRHRHIFEVREQR